MKRQDRRLFRGSFRLRGCHIWLRGGLSVTKVTKGNNNSMCLCQTQNCLYDWMGKITPADTLSAAIKAMCWEVWLSSKCTGMWVVETYCFSDFFFFLNPQCLSVRFTYQLFLLYFCIIEMTQWEISPLEIWLRATKRKFSTILLSS